MERQWRRWWWCGARVHQKQHRPMRQSVWHKLSSINHFKPGQCRLFLQQTKILEMGNRPAEGGGGTNGAPRRCLIYSVPIVVEDLQSDKPPIAEGYWIGSWDIIQLNEDTEGLIKYFVANRLQSRTVHGEGGGSWHLNFIIKISIIRWVSASLPSFAPTHIFSHRGPA